MSSLRCAVRFVTMDHLVLDRVLARTSHVPHVISAILAARFLGAQDTVLRLCGAGIRDTTRIAAGNSALWTDILQSNASEILEVLSEVTADISAVSRSLASKSTDLTDVLQRGNAGRQSVVAAVLPAAVNSSVADR